MTKDFRPDTDHLSVSELLERFPVPSIDLIEPLEAAARLGVVGDDLLGLVNAGALPAYDLDGHVRFRRHEVETLRRLRQ